jgi:hypothetical protein
MFPTFKGALDQQLASDFAAIPPNQARTNGARVGAQAAADVPVAKRRRRRWWMSSAAVGLAVAGLGVVRSAGSPAGAESAAAHTASLSLGPLAALGAMRPPGSAGTTGLEGVPVPAGPPPAPPKTTGAPIDGIECSVGEQVALHHHAPTSRSSSTGSPKRCQPGWESPHHKPRTPPGARSSAQGRVSTGSIPTQPTASSISSPRP